MSISIKFREKEVQNPLGRIAVALFVSVWSVLGIALSGLVMFMLLIMSPVLVPLHYALVRTGRRGFVTSPYPYFKVEISAAAFRKA